MSFIFHYDAGLPFSAAKLEAGTNAKSRPWVTATPWICLIVRLRLPWNAWKSERPTSR